MPSELEKWARAERQFLREELEWLNAGGKVTSPSGEDISQLMKDRKKLRIDTSVWSCVLVVAKGLRREAASRRRPKGEAAVALGA